MVLVVGLILQRFIGSDQLHRDVICLSWPKVALSLAHIWLSLARFCLRRLHGHGKQMRRAFAACCSLSGIKSSLGLVFIPSSHSSALMYWIRASRL